MATVSIIDVLSAPNLLGLIDLTKQGLPQIFPPNFTKIHKRVKRDYGEWKTQVGARTVASTTDYGAPARDDQQTNLGVQTAKLLHSFRNVRLPIMDFMNLLKVDSLVDQQMGIDEVVRQVKFHVEKNVNLRTTALASAIGTGNIWIDKTGGILPSSSGAVVTIPFNVPASNQAQLNVFGSGNIIAATWATAGTDIAGQIRALKQASIRQTGYKIKYAIYGLNVATYLANNTSLQTYMSRTAYPVAPFPAGAGPEYLASNEIPPRMLDLEWIPGYTQYYLDNALAPQTFIGNDEVIFVCDPDESGWLQNLEGSYPVPMKYAPVAAESVTSSFEEKWGMFAYGQPSSNPASAELFFGDTYLPAITNGQCLYQAVVAF